MNDHEKNENLDTYTANVSGRRLVFHHHKREHFEEILAKEFIILHADKEFMEKYFPDGHAYLGAGKSAFNEHPQNGKPRKKGDCCATLVAKALGVDEKPELQILLNYAYFSDTHNRRSKGKYPKPEEKHHPFEPARLTKALHEMYPDKPAHVAKLVRDVFIKPVLREQTEFFGNKTVFEKNGRLEKILWIDSMSLKVLVVETDNPQMHNYAFHRHVDIAVIKRSAGHVHIFTSDKIKERHAQKIANDKVKEKDKTKKNDKLEKQQGRDINLREVAMIIRIEEDKRAKKKVKEDWHDLQQEGIAGAENWWFQVGGQMILNSTHSYPHLEPTRLHVNKIIELLRIGLTPNKFHPNREEACQSGRCLSSKERRCGYFDYQLQKCRLIRYETFQKRRKEELVAV